MNEYDDEAIFSAVLGVIAFIAIIMVLASAAFAAPRIVAEYVGSDGHPRITLYDVPCESRAAAAMTRNVKPSYHPRFKAASSVFRMRDTGMLQPFAACWIKLEPPEMSESVYVVIHEDDDGYVIREADFRDHRNRRMRSI